jgi:hypothetical protein
VRKRLTLLFALTLALCLVSPHPLHGQGPWPPITVDVLPTFTGNLLTFELKVTNQVDWDLADFTLTAGIPAGTEYVEGHGDFDGAITAFDGQEVTFRVTSLPAGATLGYRYTVEAANGTRDVYRPQVLASWKGHLPGQFVLEPGREPIDATATPVAEADAGNLLEATQTGSDIIHVHGTAHQQGVERGQLLKQEIETQVEAGLASILPQAYDGDPVRWLEAIHSVITQVAPNVLDELRGMAEGSGVPLDDLEIVNFACYVTPSGTALPAGSACSVLAATEEATAAHVLVIGLNQTLNGLATPPVLIVRHFSDTEPPRLDIALPATLQTLVSVVGNGLFWEGHGVTSNEPVPAHSTDMLSLISESLEKARTVDELQQSLLAGPRLKPMIMTIASLPQQRVETLEMSHAQHRIRHPDADGLLISTHHFVSPELEELQPPPINGSTARYDRLLELAQSNLGTITPQMVRTFMHDPEVFDGSGISVVVDAGDGQLSYWDEFQQQWLEISLAELYPGPTAKQ